MTYIKVQDRIVDISFATYATDYLLAILILIQFIKKLNFTLPISGQKIHHLGQDLPIQSDQIKKILTQNLKTAIFTQFLTCLVGGFFHHFLYDYVVIFDVIGYVQLYSSLCILYVIVGSFEVGSRKNLEQINFKMAFISLAAVQYWWCVF